MGLRGRLLRLQRLADEELISFELKDGTTARFPESAFTECFMHEYERGKRHHDGEDPGPAHPMVDALRDARDLEAIMREHGTMMAAFVDEDAVVRGEVERTGPPVRETSPGVYE
jgi:hypothetical protein